MRVPSGTFTFMLTQPAKFWPISNTHMPGEGSETSLTGRFLVILMGGRSLDMSLP